MWGNMILLIIILTLVLSTVLIILNSTISSKKSNSREKASAFECGYDPKSASRLPFSMQFFLIAVIFLIFDVEITLIIPMPMIMSIFNLHIWLAVTSLFIVILVVGTIHEWKEGSLDWTK